MMLDADELYYKIILLIMFWWHCRILPHSVFDITCKPLQVFVSVYCCSTEKVQRNSCSVIMCQQRHCFGQSNKQERERESSRCCESVVLRNTRPLALFNSDALLYVA